MPYIKRTTRIGETVEVEHFYTVSKHNRTDTRKQATERLRRLVNANCKDMEELKKLLSETT